MEAEVRYHTDVEFHNHVDVAVQASLRHPAVTFATEDLERFVRNLMTRSTSLGLVLQEHTDDD